MAFKIKDETQQSTVSNSKVVIPKTGAGLTGLLLFFGAFDLIVSIIVGAIMLGDQLFGYEPDASMVGWGFGIIFQGILIFIVATVLSRLGDNIASIVDILKHRSSNKEYTDQNNPLSL